MQYGRVSVSQAVEALRVPVINRIREVLEDTSITGFNPAKLYTTFVSRDTPVMWYEPEIAKAITTLPVATSYHEFHAGIGILPFILAMTGHTTVAIEPYAARMEIGKRIMADLVPQWPNLAKRLTFVCDDMPHVFETLSTKGAMCITTNLGIKQTDAFIETFLKDIGKHYKGFVFDACLLWGIRRERHLIDAFLAETTMALQRKPVKLFERENYAEYYYVDLR